MCVKPIDEIKIIFAQGKANDTTKEFRIAREQKKKIVSPLWIRMVRQRERITLHCLYHSLKIILNNGTLADCS